MEQIWLQHQLLLIVFLSVLLLISLSNIPLWSRLSRYPAPARSPRLSVLVPARNEEANISACVESLIHQDYPSFEVLVLNDQSQDRTAEILEDLMQHDRTGRLRLVQGMPISSGWVGKNWACHQLSEIASGELLLFTDADTTYRPKALRQAVSAILAHNAGMISAFPRQVAGSWSEKLILPLLGWFGLSIMPLVLAYRWRSPGLSVAIGQMMMFRRESYEQVGGHRAVRHLPVEDFALARLVKQKRIAWRYLDGQDLVSCHMYHGFREIWHGLSRSLFGVFRNPISYCLVWLWVAMVYLEPPVVLILSLVPNSPISPPSAALAGVAVGLAVANWAMVDWKFKFPYYQALLYPVTAALITLIAFWSACRYILRRQVDWKGRTISVAGSSPKLSTDQAVSRQDTP